MDGLNVNYDRMFLRFLENQQVACQSTSRVWQLGVRQEAGRGSVIWVDIALRERAAFPEISKKYSILDK